MCVAISSSGGVPLPISSVMGDLIYDDIPAPSDSVVSIPGIQKTDEDLLADILVVRRPT